MHRKHPKLHHHGGGRSAQIFCLGADGVAAREPNIEDILASKPWHWKIMSFKRPKTSTWGNSYSCSMKYQTEPSPTKNTLECHCLVGDLLLLFKNVKPQWGKNHQQMVQNHCSCSSPISGETFWWLGLPRCWAAKKTPSFAVWPPKGHLSRRGW